MQLCKLLPIHRAEIMVNICYKLASTVMLPCLHFTNTLCYMHLFTVFDFMKFRKLLQHVSETIRMFIISLGFEYLNRGVGSHF